MYFRVVSGVVAEDLLSILKILISKNYFSEVEYNKAMKRHIYRSNESNDKPEQIDCKKSKLRGKAFSILCHLRNFGFYIYFLNPPETIFNEDCYKLLLMLSSIVEVVLASKIRKYEVSALGEEVVAYQNLRKTVYGKYPNQMNKEKPKLHNLRHYAEEFLLYGPSVGVSTSRYECKHRIAKMLANSAKNFINIAKTLAVRQQYRQSSTYYNGMFETSDIQLPSVVKSRDELEDVKDTSSIYTKVCEFLDDDSVYCDEVKFKGQSYRAEDVIVIDAINRDEVEVGVVQGIVYKDDTLYFLIFRYHAIRDYRHRYFVTVNTDLPLLSFFNAEHIVDYKPLVKHGSFSKFKFALHHHISIS